MIFTQVEYGYGAGYFVEYDYDNAGNLTQRIRHEYDATDPVTTAFPSQGFYSTPLSVTLTCSDPGGSGCDKIYYSTNGSGYVVYSSPISISVNTTLRFYAKDRANNIEDEKTQTYTFETIPPSTTASPRGGTYSIHHTPVNVTLTCNDTGGSGCEKIYYTTDGSEPTPSSPFYTGPIPVSTTTTLRFYAKDHAGNSESPKKTEVYTIDTCSSYPVRIGITPYLTIQAAYNAVAAGSTATINTRNVRFLENLLTDSLNKTIILQGGYGCDFITYNPGSTTSMKGITTTVGGGTITIKNFVLE
jgi:hypothetical protein